MIKTQLIATLLVLFLFSVANADNHGKQNHKLLLEEYPGYLKYAEPKNGTVNAKILLQGNIMVVELESPVYNIHGVETAPNVRTDDEKARVEKAKQKFLENPQRFFTFDPSKACTLMSLGYRLENVNAGDEQAKPQNIKWHHFNVRSELIFVCINPLPEVMAIDLFRAFPNIKEIDAQFMVNNSELRRVKLTPEKTGIRISGAPASKDEK